MDGSDTHPSMIMSLDVDHFLMDKLSVLLEAGFNMVEINSVDPKTLEQVLTHFPQLRVGAGGIIDTHQLETCYQAGVHFITSPGFLPAIVQTANIYAINYIPGVATLSEAMQAAASGCQQVRPYPATLHFCNLLNKNFPLLRLFPAEVEWDEVEHYLNLPAVAAVSLLNPEMSDIQILEKV